MDVGEQTASAALRIVTGLTEASIRSALMAGRSIMQMQKTHKQPQLKSGKQSLRDLNRYKKDLESVEIPDEQVKAFQKELKRQGVDFAFYRDITTGTYSAWYRSGDMMQIDAALKRCIRQLDLDKTRKQLPFAERLKAATKEKLERAIPIRIPKKVREQGL